MTRVEGTSTVEMLKADLERARERLAGVRATAEYRLQAIYKIPDLGQDEDFQDAVARVVRERDELQAQLEAVRAWYWEYNVCLGGVEWIKLEAILNPGKDSEQDGKCK